MTITEDTYCISQWLQVILIYYLIISKQFMACPQITPQNCYLQQEQFVDSRQLQQSPD